MKNITDCHHIAYAIHHYICNMQANFRGFFPTQGFWRQESCGIGNVHTQDNPLHPNIRPTRQYTWTGSSTVRMMSAMKQSIGPNHITHEIQNLPLPSHTPIKSFQHFDSTLSHLKIGWTRVVLSQRNCGQSRLQPRWLSQKKPQLLSRCSWAASQIPIKNLRFPKNSEQLSPKMSRCRALLSEKARAFSKCNRLFNVKEFKVPERAGKGALGQHTPPPRVC